MCMSPREKLLVHWCLLYNLATCTLPSTTLYYKGSRTCFPVLLSNTKLAKRAFQYFPVLQSLQVLLFSAKLAESISQDYFVLQSLQTYFPVLLCSTKLAERTSQHYFVLQRFQNVLPRTTLYYKACRTCFPVLSCTTKLAERTSQYYLSVLLHFVHVELHEAGGGSFKNIRTHRSRKKAFACRRFGKVVGSSLVKLCLRSLSFAITSLNIFPLLCFFVLSHSVLSPFLHDF